MDRETIITYVKEVTGIDTTRVTTLCQYYIDEVQDLHIARNIYEHQFSFLKAYGYLNLSPYYTTGTIALTQDSTTVTGTSTVWTSTHVGWLLKVGSTDDEYYEVSAVAGNTSLTLKNAYIGSTASGQTYALYKVNYDLASDFGNMRWIKQMDSPARVIPKKELSFTDLQPDEFDPSGEVSGYIIGGKNATTGYVMIRFTPIQTTRKVLYYCYDKNLATCNGTGVSSSIPTAWHMLFVHKLAEFVYEAHDMPAKARVEEAKFNNMLKVFVNEDAAMLRDTNTVMSDEAIYRDNSRPYVHLPSQYSPDLE
jgi:hypothetical protein